jgi:hypothetical protein
MRSITIASNVSGLESSRENFWQSIVPRRSAPTQRSGLVSWNSCRWSMAFLPISIRRKLLLMRRK